MKKTIKCGILCLMLVPALCQRPYVISAKTVNQLQQEKSRYEQNRKNAQNALEQTQQKQQSITQEIAQLDESVTQAQQELERVNALLEQTQKNLQQAQQDLAEATEKKERQMEAFQKRVKFIHENGSIGYLQAIFQAESITDMISRAEYIHQIMEYDKSTLEELKKIKASLQTEKKRLQRSVTKLRFWHSSKNKKAVICSKNCSKSNLHCSNTAKMPKNMSRSWLLGRRPVQRWKG